MVIFNSYVKLLEGKHVEAWGENSLVGRIKETGGFLSVAVKDLAPEIRTSCSGWCYPCPEFVSSPSSTASSLPHTHYMLPVGVSETPKQRLWFSCTSLR